MATSRQMTDLSLPETLLPMLRLATEKHAGQTRSHGVPYINHPLEVTKTLLDLGITDENMLAASLGHDLIEDTKCTKEEILAVSSPETLQLIGELTNSWSDHLELEAQLIVIREHASCMSPKAKTIKRADRLCNLMECEDWKPQRIRRYLKKTDALRAGLGMPILEADVILDSRIVARVNFLRKKYG